VEREVKRGCHGWEGEMGGDVLASGLELDVLDGDVVDREVEFVPEAGSILLLGSGLAGMAGYAILRWRTRE
jgi:hypothetical protein